MDQRACDPAEYVRDLRKRACVPEGFRFFSDSLTFVPPERPASEPLTMNVAGIVSDRTETRSVAVTTRNRFPGAPIRLARERLPGGTISGVIVNNRVANVAAPTGYDDARTVADAFAQRFGISSEAALSISTGVIGWSLPVSAMLERIDRLNAHETDAVAFSEAIMTTDRYPKIAWHRGSAGSPTVLGVVKGAGMIEPNLATMLGFFVTDAVVPRDRLDRVFRRVVDDTFNAISVDSDQSTSDIVLIMANGASGVEPTDSELESLVRPVAQSLAVDIVRNGEGTAHVIELTVAGVADGVLARTIAKSVINSPLVKTAVYGNDPNVGRILAACGDALDRADPDGTVAADELRISLFGIEVFRDGAFHLDGSTEKRLSDALQRAAMDPVLRGCPQETGTVPIILTFGAAEASTVTVYGSDLSYEYVRENADYRS